VVAVHVEVENGDTPVCTIELDYCGVVVVVEVDLMPVICVEFGVD
jgi:hypothetical protein